MVDFVSLAVILDINIMHKLKVLTRNNFHKWLESKSPKTKVGLTGEPCSTCPIFRFLKESNVNVKFVFSFMAVIEHFDRDIPTQFNYIFPNWVTEFIRKVDDSRKFSSISASKALKLLKSI